MTVQSGISATWHAPDRVVLVLVAVLLALAAVSAIDMAIWWSSGFKLTALNGGTLRIYDNLNYHGFFDRTLADSWKPMHDALGVLRGPDASELYQKLFFENKVKFQYPPTSLVYFLALDQLRLSQLTTLNNINAALVLIEIGLVLWLFHASFQMLWGEPSRWGLLQHMALLAAAALTFYPLIRGYYLGQIQIWLDVLFTAACLSWIKNKRVLAGVLIGLAATIKPQLGLFLVWGILWRQWPFVAGVLGAGLSVGLVSLALFGLNSHLEYLRVLSFIGSHGENFYANQSVNGLLNRLVFPDIDNMRFGDHEFAPYSPIVAWGTLAATLLLLGLGLKAAITGNGGSRGPSIYDFGLLAICVTIASPVAWEHHYGIFLPLFVIALAALYEQADGGLGDTRVLVLLAASWILVGNYLPFLSVFKGSWLNVLQSTMLLGGLLLVPVYLHLVRHGPSFEKRTPQPAAST